MLNYPIFFVSGAYDDAKEVSRHATLKYRAEMIADYETIEKPFGNEKGNPRYIYFTGKSDYIVNWMKKSEKARENYKDFLAEIDNHNSWYYDDEKDINKGKNWVNTPQHCFYTSQDYSCTSQEVPLSLYWFVDEDECNKKFQPLLMMTTSAIQPNNDVRKDEIKLLHDKIQSMEENIKHLISLSGNQQ
jgi:hypothetical protein